MLLPSEKRKVIKMFEQEIKEIQSKLVRTLNELRKVKAIEKRLHNLYWIDNSIYGLSLHRESKNKLYERASSDLFYLLEKNGLRGYGSRYNENKKSFKSYVEDIKNLTNDKFIETLKTYVNAKNYYNINPEVNGDTITIGLSDYLLNLLLNCLNIIVNGQIETQEIQDKARNTLKECNTFVYRNIKITIYKNGKTKLVFADKKILEKFKKLTVF